MPKPVSAEELVALGLLPDARHERKTEASHENAAHNPYDRPDLRPSAVWAEPPAATRLEKAAKTKPVKDLILPGEAFLVGDRPVFVLLPPEDTVALSTVFAQRLIY